MKERYIIGVDETDSTWFIVKDNESKISISFHEGLFGDNKTIIPENLQGEEKAAELEDAVNGITDWIRDNAVDIAVCCIPARTRAIWLLNDKRYWVAIARAIDFRKEIGDMNQAASFLLDQVREFIFDGPGLGMFQYDKEVVHLLGALSMLTAKEAMEVICLVHNYYQYKKHSHISLEDWATDVLWWPVRLSREQQAEAMGNDSKVIEAEDFELEEEEEEE